MYTKMFMSPRKNFEKVSITIANSVYKNTKK